MKKLSISTLSIFFSSRSNLLDSKIIYSDNYFNINNFSVAIHSKLIFRSNIIRFLCTRIIILSGFSKKFEWLSSNQFIITVMNNRKKKKEICNQIVSHSLNFLLYQYKFFFFSLSLSLSILYLYPNFFYCDLLHYITKSWSNKKKIIKNVEKQFFWELFIPSLENTFHQRV